MTILIIAASIAVTLTIFCAVAAPLALKWLFRDLASEEIDLLAEPSRAGTFRAAPFWSALVAWLRKRNLLLEDPSRWLDPRTRAIRRLPRPKDGSRNL